MRSPCLKTLQLQFLLALLLLLLVADIFPDDLLVHANGADTIATCPEMQAGKIPLTPQTFPMNTDCRLSFEPSYGVGHTELGRHAETQVHMIGHRVALHQCDALLMTEFPDDPPDAAAQLPIDHTTSVLWDENNVLLTIPTDVRLALPVSHENLLLSERGGSLKGGSLLQLYARRNGRASASLTARGGGLPVGVNVVRKMR